MRLSLLVMGSSDIVSVCAMVLVGWGGEVGSGGKLEGKTDGPNQSGEMKKQGESWKAD